MRGECEAEGREGCILRVSIVCVSSVCDPHILTPRFTFSVDLSSYRNVNSLKRADLSEGTLVHLLY